MAFSTPQSALSLAAVLVLYSIFKYVYRVLFHPLANIPGPWQARLTKLFAFAIDMGESSVVKHLPDWHRKYGPIVRIQPNELHIHDWTAYNTVMRKFDKNPSFYNIPFFDGGIFNILSGAEAKERRDIYQAHFSKATVNKLEPLIHEKLSIFLSRLRDLARTKEIVNAGNAFASFTADTVTHWAYQESVGALDVEGFKHPLLEAPKQVGPLVPATWYFQGAFKVMFRSIGLLPTWAKKRWFAAVWVTDSVRKMGANKIKNLMERPVQSKDVLDTIFGTALRPNEEKGQKPLTEYQLTGDAVTMFLAGSDTTAITLVRATWEVLRHPDILAKLQAELDGAMPDGDKLYKQSDLERLPYLRAVVKESLRCAMGTACRLSRTTPPEGAEICGQYIAGGTNVSFSAYVYNYDESIFPNPHSFRPERWLEGDVSLLETRMVTFGKGARSCIGINVAYCELYNTIAHVFRRFSMTIVETTEQDMVWKDCFVPRFKGELKVRLEIRV